MLSYKSKVGTPNLIANEALAISELPIRKSVHYRGVIAHLHFGGIWKAAQAHSLDAQQYH